VARAAIGRSPGQSSICPSHYAGRVAVHVRWDQIQRLTDFAVEYRTLP